MQHKLRPVVSYLAGLQIPAHAAHAGYFIVLSLFPALVLLLALLRHTGLGADHLTEMLEGLLPEVLMPYAQRLIRSTYRNTSGVVVSLSAVTTLWSASRGVHGLVAGVQHIYKAPRQGSWLENRLRSILYTVVFLLMLVLTLVVHVFGNSLFQLFPVVDTPFYRFLRDVIHLRFFLLLGVQTLFFAVIFRFLPGRRAPLHCTLPGAVLASFGWLVFSGLFSVYASHLHVFSNVYGSVYTVAVSMLWLYFCLSIVFYAAALNAFLLETIEKN